MRTITSLIFAASSQATYAALSDIKNYATNRCAARSGTPCEQCAGDCDTDSDCKGSLVCYQYSGEVSTGLNTASTIPSCFELNMGWAITKDWDYCVDPTVAKGLMESPRAYANAQLKDYGASPMWVTGNGKGAKASYGLKLGNCAGDCDYDSDCGSGMKCYQRGKGGSVPGCSGTPVNDHDYCIYPDGKFPTNNPTRQPTRVPTTNRPTRSPTRHPTTKRPTNFPTRYPTRPPTTRTPTRKLTKRPTQEPTTGKPTAQPTAYPTAVPTTEPTRRPTVSPTKKSCSTEITCPPLMRNNFLPCPSGGCTQKYCCEHIPTINPPRPPVFPQQTAEPTSAPTNTPPIKNCVTEITCPPHMRNTFLPCPKGGCTQDHCCRHMPSINPPRPPVFPPQPPVLPPMNKPCNPEDCQDWTCKDWCKCFMNYPHLVDVFEGPNPSPKEQAIREKCPSDNDECDCADYNQ